MKKYKVTWYYGSVCDIESVIDEKEFEAESIGSVPWATILPEDEKKRYEANFKYCIRVIYLEADKKHSIDYGSYTKFVMIEEIND